MLKGKINMSHTPNTLCNLLDTLEIPYQRFHHPAVFTTADIELLPEKLPGIDVKNLFLRDDKRTRFVLVAVRAEKRVDLKQLGRSLGIKGLTFGSPDELQSMLGVSPGSVCLFALANDEAKRVEGFIDLSIDLEAEMQNHPLINTESLVLQTSQMFRFCEYTDHALTRLEIPERGDIAVKSGG